MSARRCRSALAAGARFPPNPAAWSGCGAEPMVTDLHHPQPVDSRRSAPPVTPADDGPGYYEDRLLATATSVRILLTSQRLGSKPSLEMTLAKLPLPAGSTARSAPAAIAAPARMAQGCCDSRAGCPAIGLPEE